MIKVDLSKYPGFKAYYKVCDIDNLTEDSVTIISTKGLQLLQLSEINNDNIDYYTGKRQSVMLLIDCISILKEFREQDLVNDMLQRIENMLQMIEEIALLSGKETIKIRINKLSCIFQWLIRKGYDHAFIYQELFDVSFIDNPFNNYVVLIKELKI